MDQPATSDETTEVFSLIYLSNATVPMSRASLDELATRAARANVLIDVTGYLTHRHNRFTQYLEGTADQVGDLMRRIRRDQRHSVLTTIELGPVPRRFPGWSMRLLDPLWYPSGGPLEAIDELLGVVDRGDMANDDLRDSLNRLVANISDFER